MVRKLLMFVFAAAFVLALPADAAPPFGSFGGQVGGGNGGAGVIPLHGWALDDDGIAAIDIYVDGRVAGRARYGRFRPGVTTNHPGFPNTNAPGFAFELDSTRYLNGVHNVTAVATSLTGESVTLGPSKILFTNLTHNLEPFGRITFPNADAELRGNCDLLSPDRRYNVVNGWALDVGVETGDQGVGYVELLIDGAIFASSRRDCFFSPVTGQTNCYGLRRFDVVRSFPDLENSTHSGFRFVMDIGALLNSGYAEGQHVLTIRAGDISGQVANIDEFPVVFSCDDGNEESFGKVERPRVGLIYSGVLEMKGWTLDFQGVRDIEVYVDGIFQGLAVHGVPRPGVAGKFPGYPESAGPGWTFGLDTSNFGNGSHEVLVLVRDDLGVDTVVGRAEVLFFN